VHLLRYFQVVPTTQPFFSSESKITALEEKLVKARQVKAGMMSELLTGRRSGWCEEMARGRIILDWLFNVTS
jgi:hypothetical protein